MVAVADAGRSWAWGVVFRPVGMVGMLGRPGICGGLPGGRAGALEFAMYDESRSAGGAGVGRKSVGHSCCGIKGIDYTSGLNSSSGFP